MPARWLTPKEWRELRLRRIPFIRRKLALPADGHWGMLVETLVAGLDPPELDAHALRFLARRDDSGCRCCLAHLYGEGRANELLAPRGFGAIQRIPS